MRGIDTTRTLLSIPGDNSQSHVHQAQSAGVGFSLRYSADSGNFPTKALKPQEAKNNSSLGIYNGFVCEHGENNYGAFSAGATHGNNRADECIALFAACGVNPTPYFDAAGNYQDGPAAFFPCDYDPSDPEITGNIQDSLVAFHDRLRNAGGTDVGFRIGAYCSGRMFELLGPSGAGLIHILWLCQSPGFEGFDRWKDKCHIFQEMPPSTLDLGGDKFDVDWNTLRTDTPEAAGLWLV
jgi:hypothetical protein